MQMMKEFQNHFDDEFCDRVIDIFEDQDGKGCTRTRHDVVRRDTQVNFNEYEETNFKDAKIAEEFFKSLGEGLDRYLKDLGLDNIFVDGLWFKDMLVQRSRADSFESYSTWHAEVSNKQHSDRVLTYVLYLNDDYEGGETQFMYQKHNVKPEKGKLVIFPAHFTHVHRGNMINEGTKYIITGWCFY